MFSAAVVCCLAVTIGSNIASLRASRQFDKVSSAVSRVFERLSSGQRINRAGDDPAGLSVSLGLGTKARVLNRAAQNLSDATSLITIADSALGEIGNILTRLGELAQQAANGTFSSAQRRTLGEEYTTLDREIRRIAASTEFNGLSLLTGQRSNRASSVLYTASGASTLQVLDTSSDGRFVLARDDVEGGFVIDTSTGERRLLANVYFIQAHSQSEILDNGDVVSNYLDNIVYYTYATQQSVVLTAGTGNSFTSWSTRVSQDGRYITFISTDSFAPDGQGSDPGAQRVWQIDVASRTTRLIGDATDYSSFPSTGISSDGRYYAWQTSTGLNIIDTQSASPSPSSYVGNVNSMLGVTTSGETLFTDGINLFRTSGASTVTQLSQFTQSNSLVNASMSADGSIVSFVSSRNLNGNNAGGFRQAYSWDLSTGEFVMRTNYRSLATAFDFGTIISADGSRAFRWDVANEQLLTFDTSAADSRFDFEAGFGAAGNILGAYASFSSALRGLGSGVLSSQFGARIALDRVRGNLENLAQLRGTLGAVQSRLATGTSLARVQADGALSANARIKDADVAAEAGELTRLSILQQAGASLLAQANQQPALALQLLRQR